MHSATLPHPVASRTERADRVGVLASVLCAIHCLVTPPLLLLMPAFGRFWSHPASHWGMALVVVPLAIFTMARGYRTHRRKRVLVAGSLGAILILAGAALPFIEPDSPVGAAGCEACCPSLQTDADGGSRLEVPPAAIVTTLGGAALVLTHLGNLCGCRSRCCPPAP